MKFIQKLSTLFIYCFQHPVKTISKISLKNIRILINAVKYEDQETILENFASLIGDEKNKVSHKTNVSQPTENKTPAEPMIKMPSFKRKEETEVEKKNSFYSLWDDSYIEKHVDYLSNFEDPQQNGKKYVAIIADLNLPQCKKYRVLQKIEILKRKGIMCDFSHWLDVPRSINLMQNASSVIFYRIPFSKLTSSYLDEASRLNLTIGYDIDDPIFDQKIYKSNTNLDFLDRNEKNQLLNNAKHYASLIRQCHFLTTSTPFMKEVLSKYTKAKIYLWRNLMDAQSINAAHIANQLIEKNLDIDNFVIGYMSGSRAHEADFNIASEAIEFVMGKYKYVEFHITGYAELANKLKKKYPKRIKHIPFTDYYQYMEGFINYDVNIIPLVQNQFNECKSAIRFLESSLLDVPSIVSYIGDFKHIIKNKETGIFVYKNSTSEWISALEWSINNKLALGEIGTSSKIATLKEYSSLSYTQDSINQEIFDIEI